MTRQDYMRNYMYTYLGTSTGFLKKQYNRFKQRKMCEVSQDEFIAWSLSDKNFVALFETWKTSGRQTPLRPSVDRIDEYKGYSLSNMQWVTWEQNHIKMRTEKKNVLSYTKTFSDRHKQQQYMVIVENDTKKFFMIFKNMNEIISCFPFMSKKHISSCVNAKRKTHWGFSFRKYGD